MPSSETELGISDDHSGIIELPADAPIGTDIREYLKLDDNTHSIPSDGSPRSFAALILKSPGSTAPMVATATFSP
jgi:hypothetical protein